MSIQDKTKTINNNNKIKIKSNVDKHPSYKLTPLLYIKRK